MTERYYALTVVLTEDIREDDAQSLISAIQMLRGVATVTPHVADFTTHWAEQRAKQELRAKIIELLR